MKRYFVVLLSLIFVLGLTVPVLAIHPSQPAEVSPLSAKGDSSVILGGSIRLRGDTRNNIPGFTGDEDEPYDERTASYLSSAGALYYSHRQYDLARKYYKTMVTKFPESQQRSVGLLSLMNSYFFLGKYTDAEFVAKKILALPGRILKP